MPRGVTPPLEKISLGALAPSLKSQLKGSGVPAADVKRFQELAHALSVVALNDLCSHAQVKKGRVKLTRLISIAVRQAREAREPKA